MNKKNQKTVSTLAQELREKIIKELERVGKPGETLKELAGKVNDVKSQIETIRDEGSEKLDSMSDNARDGDRGQELQEEVDGLEEAISCLEEAETALQEEVDNDELTVGGLAEIVDGVCTELDNAAEKLTEF
jgi:chromosome segregation ATPase